MKRSGFTEEQITLHLREQEAGSGGRPAQEAQARIADNCGIELI